MKDVSDKQVEITNITDISDFSAALRKLSQKKSPVQHRRAAMFLGAWIIGVEEVGQQFFNLQSDVALYDIYSIENIKPNLEIVSRDVAQLERSKAALLLVMCDFYCPGFAKSFSQIFDITNLPELTLLLNPNARQVVSALFENFSGWETRK